MGEDTTVSVVAFSLHLAVMLGMGLWYYRRNYDMSEFVPGGRKLRGIIVAFFGTVTADTQVSLR